MTDYGELVKALRYCQFGECGCGKCYYKELKGDWCTEDNHPEFFDCDDKLKLDAAAAIEALQAEVEDLTEALNVESEARQNAEAKGYCYNCAYMDASMYDEAWYGICKQNGFEVGAIHGWGCTDWAKMEVQDG